MGRNAKKEENRQIFRTLALITQLGISMLVPVFLCVWFGTFLKKRFSFDIVLLLLILGILAGCRNCYRLLSDVVKGDRSERK